MDQPTLNIVRQNYSSNCFKCGKSSKNFAIYNCQKCEPKAIEKYCFGCCEKSAKGKEQDINVLCTGCAFCYNYIHVTEFFINQKEGGWQGLKYDCEYCQCCCGSSDCITGSLRCCIDGIEEHFQKKLIFLLSE